VEGGVTADHQFLSGEEEEEPGVISGWLSEIVGRLDLNTKNIVGRLDLNTKWPNASNHLYLAQAVVEVVVVIWTQLHHLWLEPSAVEEEEEEGEEPLLDLPSEIEVRIAEAKKDQALSRSNPNYLTLLLFLGLNLLYVLQDATTQLPNPAPFFLLADSFHIHSDTVEEANL
jgi:hypothetical protein